MVTMMLMVILIAMMIMTTMIIRKLLLVAAPAAATAVTAVDHMMMITMLMVIMITLMIMMMMTMTGYVQTPGWNPEDGTTYPSGMDSWVSIPVPEGHKVIISVIELDTEEHQACLYDWLELFLKQTVGVGTTTAHGLSTTMTGEDTTMMGGDTTMMGGDTTMMGGDTTMMGGDTTMTGEDTTTMEEDTTMMGRDATMMGEDTTMMGGETTMMEDYTTSTKSDRITDRKSLNHGRRPNTTNVAGGPNCDQTQLANKPAGYAEVDTFRARTFKTSEHFSGTIRASTSTTTALSWTTCEENKETMLKRAWRVCGSQRPDTVMAEASVIYVRFHSDGKNQRTGARIFFSFHKVVFSSTI